MTKAELVEQIKGKGTYLCVGLDTDVTKIPKHLLTSPDPVFEFNRNIIDATKEFCVAYKPNLAFYECLGPSGWESLRKTLEYIPKTHFTIADAKRGDIGNTSEMYARTFFEQYPFDSVTVAPYMGSDSVTPFLKFKNKWVILLAHTSNPGSADFQLMESAGAKLYETVVRKAQTWATPEQLMFVVGATHPETFKAIRELAPHNFFLVPGVGAQGGDLKQVSLNGMNNDCGLLVNSSRAIIYATSGVDFAKAAGAEAQKIAAEMRALLREKDIL